jgi:hypothetical protein
MIDVIQDDYYLYLANFAGDYLFFENYIIAYFLAILNIKRKLMKEQLRYFYYNSFLFLFFYFYSKKILLYKKFLLL